MTTVVSEVSVPKRLGTVVPFMSAPAMLSVASVVHALNCVGNGTASLVASAQTDCVARRTGHVGATEAVGGEVSATRRHAHRQRRPAKVVVVLRGVSSLGAVYVIASYEVQDAQVRPRARRAAELTLRRRMRKVIESKRGGAGSSGSKDAVSVQRKHSPR